MQRHPKPLSKEAQAEYRARVEKGMYRDAVEACWKQLGVEVIHGDMMDDVYADVFGKASAREAISLDRFDTFFRMALRRRFNLPW